VPPGALDVVQRPVGVAREPLGSGLVRIEAGDAALAAVGAAIRGELRSSDVAGRLGGDEFGVILTDTTLEGAGSQARRIGQALDTEASAVALSLGVACLDPVEPTAERLVHDADRALYHVKHTGRHGIAQTTAGGMPARLAS
jgi:diguanylate cyclase (GGDEF)-like protein